ncbi:MAG: methylated-DNA--[protein]-cysteine S-methyltransferase [Victivallaceae bacterium]|nr:methylated-DNA--[protein]-cysteine S-methyltransferase [Victivallaceae bacterium]
MLIVGTPLGRIGLCEENGKLSQLVFSPPGFTAGTATPFLLEAARQLSLYLSGKLTAFTLPLAPAGGTEFQRTVWNALIDIPFGKAESYGGIAVKIGNPHAARAVGMACRCNPLPIMIPCHRVLGSGGKLTGYAGELSVKKQLLKLEKIAFCE